MKSAQKLYQRVSFLTMVYPNWYLNNIWGFVC